MGLGVSVPEHRTPVEAGRILADWVVRKGSNHILDPAMGTGALLSCVLSRFESLGVPHPLTRIYGVEINPQRVREAATALGDHRKTSLHFFVGDFLLEGVPDHEAGIFDGIVCNPPFLRWQAIPSEYRKLLNGAKGLDGARGPSGLAGLHVFFVRRALDYARRGGRLAFILPSSAFAASYARTMRLLLRDQTTIGALLTIDPKLEVFPGVMTNVTLLLFEKGIPPKSHRPFIARLSGIPSPAELRESLDTSSRNKLTRVLRPLQKNLSPKANWANLETRQPPTQMTFISLDKIADVRRGIATGCNAYFTLSRDAVEDLRLPDHALRRFIPNLRVVGYEVCGEDIERMASAGKKTFLLSVSPPLMSHPGVKAYLDFGKATGVPTGYLTSNRTTWYRLESRMPAPIVFTYMTRTRPRFLLNTSGAVYLNNLIGIYPGRNISNQRLLALLAILNSNPLLAQLERVGREYAGGLVKWEPGDLSRLQVPDPSRLRKRDVDRLAKAFRRLTFLARLGLVAQGLSDMDKVVRTRVRFPRTPGS